MKIKLMFFCVSLIYCSCNNIDNKTIKGSWYSVNKDAENYEEVHIDDSLFIYCYDNCNVVLTFNYILRNDSIFLFLDNKHVKDNYKIVFANSSQEELHLINKQGKLNFLKMNKTYSNLNEFLISYESLDSLSCDYFQRKKIIMNK